MSFGGSAAAMIASIKANKRRRISTFEKLKNFKKAKKSTLLLPNKATKKDLKEIRERIQQQNKTSFIKKIVAIISALVVLYFLMRLDSY